MLTRYNAQKIVDKTLKIFGSNINIIDCNGIILASGDPARVNTFHEGAFIAVKENRVVEIDERESSKFKGARWGVNYPIYYRGKIQGVVGITGDPKEVRKLAVILKEMVELILSEIEFMNIKSLESKVEVAYLKELLSKKEITPEFAERGKLLGIDLELPRVCLIIEILDFKKIIKRYSDKYKDTYERELALQTFKNDFEEYIRKYCSIKDKVFHLEEDVFIVLKEYHGSFLIINKFVEMITEKLEREFSTKTLIAIGEPVETSRDIAFSYRTAKTTMKILNKIKNNSNYLFATDYKIHSLVIDNLDTIRTKLKYQLEVITSIKNWDQLKITLEKYIQNNMNILKTSKDLGIHRNTVLIRLEKIKESLSLDPFNLEDCFILKLLLILEDFN